MVLLALILSASAEPPPGMRLVDVPPDWVVVDMYGDPVDSLTLAQALDDRATLRRLRGDQRFAILYGLSAMLAGGAATYVAVRASSHVLLPRNAASSGIMDDPTRPGRDSAGKARVRNRKEREQQQDNIALVVGAGAVALIITAPIPLLDAEPRRRDPARVYDRATVADMLPIVVPPPPPPPEAAPSRPVLGVLPRVRLPEPP